MEVVVMVGIMPLDRMAVTVIMMVVVVVVQKSIKIA